MVSGRPWVCSVCRVSSHFKKGPRAERACVHQGPLGFPACGLAAGLRPCEGMKRGRRGPGVLSQRPLPPQSHGEELRFVENGCHDNPTLDVASDSQSEMQEKQPSLNGGGAVNGPGGWSALMGDKRDPEDSDVFEEDTHL